MTRLMTGAAEEATSFVVVERALVERALRAKLGHYPGYPNEPLTQTARPEALPVRIALSTGRRRFPWQPWASIRHASATPRGSRTNRRTGWRVRAAQNAQLRDGRQRRSGRR